jgi:hypothetical protein
MVAFKTDTKVFVFVILKIDYNATDGEYGHTKKAFCSIIYRPAFVPLKWSKLFSFRVALSM